MMYRILMAILLVLVMASIAVTAEHDGSVVWQEEFNEPQLSPFWSTYFCDGSKGRKTDKEISLKVADGALTASCNFEGSQSSSYAAVVYGSPSDQMVKAVKPWPGIEVSETPVIEVRFRRMTLNSGFTLIVNYETYGGEHSAFVSYLAASVPTSPGEWATFTNNFYNDPKIVGPAGIKRITGIQFFLGILQQEGHPTVSIVTSWDVIDQVDYIRLRRMTAQEWAKMQEGMKGARTLNLGEFKMQPAPRVENLFALGFYNTPGAFWAGGEEPGFDHLARHWCNTVYPSWAGRFGDGDIKESDRATHWVKITKEEVLPLGKKYGFYFLLNMQGFIRKMSGAESGTPVDKLDIDQLNKWADEVTTAMKDEETVLGWYAADEPSLYGGPDVLTDYLIVKQMLETRDRSRPALCLFNNIPTVKAYAPYQQIMLTDYYPVLSGRAATDVAGWMSEVRKATGAPHWITLECVRVPGKRRGASPEEFRLEAWLAIAGGAKGINYYIYHIGPYWRNGGEEGMVDPYGNPHPVWYEFEKFADEVAPIGELLVNSQVDEDAKVTPFPEALKVGMLKLKDYDGYVVAPVNFLLTAELPAQITFPDSKGYVLYDLVALQKLEGTNNNFNLGKLRVGEGHPYFWGNKKEIHKVRNIVLRAKAKQAIRVAGLDVYKGERHKIQTADCQKQIDKAKKYLKKNKFQAVLEESAAISKAIEGRLLAKPDYTGSEKELSVAAKQMAEIDNMLDEILNARSDVSQLRGDPLGKSMIVLGERYNELKKDFFWGRTEGLAQKTRDLLKDIGDFASEVKTQHKKFVKKD